MSQDLEHILPSASREPEIFNGLQERGIELMYQDMFKSQPVADARYSFFGTIFHGKPDSDVVATLRDTVRVIGMDSRILVYETVLPEEGAVLFHACFDLWIMAEVSGKERTRSEWGKLLA